MIWEYNTLCPAGREEKERNERGREARGGEGGKGGEGREGRQNWNRQLPISPGLICFQRTFF